MRVVADWNRGAPQYRELYVVRCPWGGGANGGRTEECPV